METRKGEGAITIDLCQHFTKRGTNFCSHTSHGRKQKVSDSLT